MSGWSERALLDNENAIARSLEETIQGAATGATSAQRRDANRYRGVVRPEQLADLLDTVLDEGLLIDAWTVCQWSAPGYSRSTACTGHLGSSDP